jgi:hypothetical protein
MKKGNLEIITETDAKVIVSFTPALSEEGFVHVREVLPGDPDPDVVLEVLESIKSAAKLYYPTGQGILRIWHDRIEESRSK